MGKSVWTWIAAAGLAPAALGAGCPPPQGPISPWQRLADFAGIPTWRAERTVRFSSYDRGRITETVFGPLNKDNNNFLAVCGAQPEMYLQDSDGLACEAGADGYLLAKVSGEPGWISRMWFAKSPEPFPGEPWANQRLVIYLDDLSTPALDVPVAFVKLGLVPALPFPFTGGRSGGLSTYAPLAFNDEMRVYIRGADTEYDLLYYQIDVTLPGAPVVPYTPTPSSADVLAASQASAKWNALGANPNAGFTNVLLNAPRTLAAGGETALFEETAAGVVERLEIALPESSQPDWDALTLRMTWDGAAAPQVDLPLAGFFGLDLARTEYEGLFLGHRASGGTSTLYAYLPMPYRTGARIAIVNGTAAPIDAAVTVGVDRALPPEPFGALHAVRNEVLAPAPTGSHRVADLAGRGALVGVSLSIQGHADETLLLRDPFNYLEGDDRIEIDGAPPMLGTGTEEIADGAWYFRPGDFMDAMTGAPLVHEIDADHGETSHFRWYVQGGALNFSESLRYEIEYGVQNPDVVDRYVSTAFYYLTP